MSATEEEATASPSRISPTQSGRPSTNWRRMRRSGPGTTGRSAVLVFAAQLLIIVGVIALWQTANSQEWITPALLGSPRGVLEELIGYYQGGRLVGDIIATLSAMVYSLLIGVPIGVVAGMVLAAVPTLDRVVGPLLIPINSLPRIALAPLFVVWFGLTIQAKVGLAVTIVFFIVVFNARSGIKSVDPDMLVVARLLGMSQREVFRKVVLPHSVPTIFAGVRLAVTYSLLGVVAMEMIAARDGLGTSIIRYSSQFNVSGVFAVLLVLAVIASIIALFTERLERFLLRWQ